MGINPDQRREVSREWLVEGILILDAEKPSETCSSSALEDASVVEDVPL